MYWDAANPLQAFRALADFWHEDQGNRRDQYYQIVYLLGPIGIEAWKSVTWDNPTDNENPAMS